MRTIKRQGAEYGDFRSRCGYCGVVWMRSRLIRDRAGLYACPDDQAGRDVVTLSELNAAGAQELRQTPQRDGSDDDKGGEAYITTPSSILSRQELMGWWQPRQSGTILASGFSWIPNVRQFDEGGDVGSRRGAVAQGDPSLQPAYVDGQTNFETDYLESTRRDITEVDANPVIWMVGSFTATGGMFQLRGVGNIPVSEGVGLPPVLQLGYDSATGQIRADATYEGNSGGSGNGTFLSASAALPDANLHLFRITQGISQLELQIDDGTVTTQLTSTESDITGTGTPSVYDKVGYGLRGPVLFADLGFETSHTGRLEEVVVSSSNATTDQLTAMRNYFKAQYPELP